MTIIRLNGLNRKISFAKNDEIVSSILSKPVISTRYNELVEIETKLDRLLDLQLDGSLSQTEYTAKKYKLILAKKDLEKKSHLLGERAIIGSNFRIAERTLSFPLKNAWVIAEKYHAEAQRAEASNLDFSKCDSWRRRWDSNPRVP